MQQFMLVDLRISPSSLLQHYLVLARKNKTERPYFTLCLAAIIQWSHVLQRSNNQDLKKALYEDLCANGSSLYQ